MNSGLGGVGTRSPQTRINQERIAGGGQGATSCRGAAARAEPEDGEARRSVGGLSFAVPWLRRPLSPGPRLEQGFPGTRAGREPRRERGGAAALAPDDRA